MQWEDLLETIIKEIKGLSWVDHWWEQAVDSNWMGLSETQQKAKTET